MYILAFDQGTTGSRSILFDKSGRIVAAAAREFPQIYPKPGWVEHDPAALWETQYGTALDVIKKADIKPGDITAIGITNQRETTMVWEKATGKPIYNAIVWQCRRTADACDRLRAAGQGALITERTGLKPDAYFSGTKVAWLLENVPGAREKAEKGELLFGTVDTWLIWQLTDGATHVTDHTNASRTMLYNIHTLDWDADMLKLLNIPRLMLPGVVPSSGITAKTKIFGGEIPITGIAGDQQAALFGQACFEAGQVKNTYGTGCFLLMNTGEKPVNSRCGLLTTMAASVGNTIQYALEGSVFIGGAVVQWLRDELGMLTHAAESETVAASVADTQGVYLVPAFVGLGAPYWDAHARGTLTGLTRGTNRAHIVRAALESMAYQTQAIVTAMAQDLGVENTIKKLPVDGGASANHFLMQFQADILSIPVERPKVIETTALGAAYLAGLAVGYWESKADIINNRVIERVYEPNMEEGRVRELLSGWEKAVAQTLNRPH